MKTSEWMTSSVNCCVPGDTMERAAQIMWDGDCGCVPVVDESQSVLGVITDRDICMAAYTRGQPLASLPVNLAMSGGAIACRIDDDLERALELMARHRVRRLPVIDGSMRLRGMLSLADVLQGLRSDRRARVRLADGVLETLMEVTHPRSEVELRPAPPPAAPVLAG